MKSNKPRRVICMVMVVCGMAVIMLGIASSFVPALSEISWIIVMMGAIDVVVGTWLFLSSRRKHKRAEATVRQADHKTDGCRPVTGRPGDEANVRWSDHKTLREAFLKRELIQNGLFARGSKGPSFLYIHSILRSVSHSRTAS